MLLKKIEFNFVNILNKNLVESRRPQVWNLVLIMSTLGCILTLSFNFFFVFSSDFETNSILNRVAFGSCHKPWLDNSIFNTIKSFEPEIFIWTGDAYYTSVKKQNITGKSTEIKALKHAVNMTIESKTYKDFLKSLKLFPSLNKFESLQLSTFGAWDDHDVGINDVGREMSDALTRQQIYLDFIFGRSKSNLRQEITKRDGLYYSILFGAETKHRVKFIVLDTRSQRDAYIFPSIAFLTTLTNTLTRFIATITGLEYFFQSGTILGKRQWEWLETELEESSTSDIEVNIIVSSIPVFTRNILTETWLHFPKERQRLLVLLEKYPMKGTLFLSGDVHIGQLIRFSTEHDYIEVTSSGLTHDCSDGMIPYFVCYFVYFIASYGLNPFYIGKNFGFINFDWFDKTYNVAVRNETGYTKLNFKKLMTKSFIDSNSLYWRFNASYEFVILWCVVIACCALFASAFLRSNGTKEKTE